MRTAIDRLTAPLWARIPDLSRVFLRDNTYLRQPPGTVE